MLTSPPAVAIALSLVTLGAAAPQPMIGTQAPGFELADGSGKKVSLVGLKGKVVVLHFAASW